MQLTYKFYLNLSKLNNNNKYFYNIQTNLTDIL